MSDCRAKVIDASPYRVSFVVNGNSIFEIGADVFEKLSTKYHILAQIHTHTKRHIFLIVGVKR